MKYLGNDQWQIRNTKTGQTKNVATNELGNYGLTPEQSQTGLMRDITGIGQNIGGFAKDIGLGGAVDLLARNSPLGVIQNATGVNPLLNSATLQQEAQHPVANVLGDVGAAAADLGGGELLGMAGKGIAKAAPYVKFAATHPTMTKAVVGQGEQVAGDTLHPIQSLLSDSLKEAAAKHEFNANIAKEVQSIWDTKLAAPKTIEELSLRNNGAGIQTPVKKSIQGITHMTAKQLLNLRQDLSGAAKFGQNVYSDGAAANRIVYRTINNFLKGEKGVAPGLKVPDRVIKAYSNKYFKEGPKIPLTGLQIPYPSSMQGLPAGIANSLIALLGGEELVKHVGIH